MVMVRDCNSYCPPEAGAPFPLPPPNCEPSPHGAARGGIFDAPWVSNHYHAGRTRTVPGNCGPQRMLANRHGPRVGFAQSPYANPVLMPPACPPVCLPPCPPPYVPPPVPPPPIQPPPNVPRPIPQVPPPETTPKPVTPTPDPTRPRPVTPGPWTPPGGFTPQTPPGGGFTPWTPPPGGGFTPTPTTPPGGGFTPTPVTPRPLDYGIWTPPRPAITRPGVPLTPSTAGRRPPIYRIPQSSDIKGLGHYHCNGNGIPYAQSPYAHPVLMPPACPPQNCLPPCKPGMMPPIVVPPPTPCVPGVRPPCGPASPPIVVPPNQGCGVFGAGPDGLGQGIF